jgi:hypothetical protein
MILVEFFRKFEIGEGKWQFWEIFIGGKLELGKIAKSLSFINF